MLTLSAAEISTLQERIASRQPNYGLPRPFYHEELLYRIELEYIWRGGWLFAGHSCQIPNPGDYFLYDVGEDSLIIVRDDEARRMHSTMFAVIVVRSFARLPKAM